LRPTLLFIPSSLAPSQGFPEKPAGFFNTDKLSLAAVGMRRKNFMVVEVDVYLVALSLSPSALLATKNWKKAQTGDPLAEVILQQGRNLKVSPAQDESMATATLRFVRAVGKSQIVEAFSDAFKGVDPAAVTAFKDALAGAIPGDAGLKVGDEFRCVGLCSTSRVGSRPPPYCASHPHRLLPFCSVPGQCVVSFIWPKSGGLIVTTGAYTSKKVESADIARRLLEVYVEESRTVSKELVQCIMTTSRRCERGCACVDVCWGLGGGGGRRDDGREGSGGTRAILNSLNGAHIKFCLACCN